MIELSIRIDGSLNTPKQTAKIAQKAIAEALGLKTMLVAVQVRESLLAAANDRLEYLRRELRKGKISYGELAELQGLDAQGKIPSGDVELLEAAGVPELPENAE